MYAIFMFRQKEDDHLEMDVAREKDIHCICTEHCSTSKVATLKIVGENSPFFRRIIIPPQHISKLYLFDKKNGTIIGNNLYQYF